MWKFSTFSFYLHFMVRTLRTDEFPEWKWYFYSVPCKLSQKLSAEKPKMLSTKIIFVPFKAPLTNSFISSCTSSLAVLSQPHVLNISQAEKNCACSCNFHLFYDCIRIDRFDYSRSFSVIYGWASIQHAFFLTNKDLMELWLPLSRTTSKMNSLAFKVSHVKRGSFAESKLINRCCEEEQKRSKL